MTDLESYQDYSEEVKRTAEIAIEEAKEHGEGEIEPWELAWEQADNHQWIIYTGYHLSILQYSDSEPEEWKHMVSDGDSWREVIQTLAFVVFRQDIAYEIEDQLEE